MSRKEFLSNRSASTSEIDDAVLTLSQKEAAHIEWPMRRFGGRAFFFLIGVVFSVLVGRLFYLNIIDGEYYRKTALKNSIRSLVLSAPRGIIYDRYGKPLVENIPSVDAIIVPKDLPGNEDGQKNVFAQVQGLLGLDTESISTIGEYLHSANGSSPVPIKENLSQDEVVLLASHAGELPGINLLKSARRKYVDSQVYSHILGYEGKIEKQELNDHPTYLFTDSLGKQGIEKSYERELRGTAGAEQSEVNALGNIKKELGILSPIPGNNLTLNIDADLQKKMYMALTNWLEEHGLKQAAGIALDPRTGAVLSLVSLPSFDNNLFAGGISSDAYRSLITDPAMPLFNRAVSGAYPPGSTIKPILATAALSEKIITPETQIESRGGISVGNFFFGDWRVNGFTDIRRAIAVSSDVYFYTIGGGYGGIAGLGMERMKKYEQLFGWGEKTGIDLPGEVTGLLPDPAWKKERFGERWYIGDDYHAAIGQGFVTATPIQIVNAMVAIANGGTLYQPQIVSQVHREDGSVTSINPKILRSAVADPTILQIVREGMRATVTEGTAQSLNDLPVAVAGKTGTAQFGNLEKTHGWFVSFAPFDNPKIVMLILVEGQSEEGYNAVPITKDILSWYFSRPE